MYILFVHANIVYHSLPKLLQSEGHTQKEKSLWEQTVETMDANGAFECSKEAPYREILWSIKKTIMVLSIVLFRAAYCQYRKALTQRLQSAFTSPSSLSSFSPPNPHTRNASLPSSTLRSPFSLCILLLWLPERPSYEHLLYLLIIVRALLRVWQSDKSAHQRQKNRTTTRRAILHTTKGLFSPWLARCFWRFLLRRAGRIYPTGLGVLLYDCFLTRPLQLGSLDCIQLGYRVLVRTSLLDRWSSDIEMFWCDWIRIRVNRTSSRESASAG